MKRIVPLLLITLLTGLCVSCEQVKIEDTMECLIKSLPYSSILSIITLEP